jgi:hypothetical protein
VNLSLLFACGLLTTLGISPGVVAYMRRPLGILLQELCGTRERAEFWTVFSSVTVALVPAIFAMSYRPQADAIALFEVVSQLKWGLVGLVMSVLMLGWILSRFIPKTPVTATDVQG